MSRWKGQPICPFCACNKIKTINPEGFFRCLLCEEKFTVRTGTIWERSHISLDKWFFAFYLIVTARKGISSLQISKELGITQKSAWFMLHRIREACGADLIKLKGVIEADECYIGGKESNKHKNKKLHAGRGTVGKTVVLGLKERNGNVRAMIVKGTDATTIQNELKNNITSGSVLCTDEHASYKGMDEFYHLEVNHSAKEFVNGMAHTNSIESVWAVLKRGYYGTYHNFSTKHLHRYVNEFTFRLNQGNCKIPSMDRIDALIQGAIRNTLSYKNLKQ
jgi:transposase-like protein